MAFPVGDEKVLCSSKWGYAFWVCSSVWSYTLFILLCERKNQRMNCPACNRPIEDSAISCPYCRVHFAQRLQEDKVRTVKKDLLDAISSVTASSSFLGVAVAMTLTAFSYLIQVVAYLLYFAFSTDFHYALANFDIMSLMNASNFSSTYSTAVASFAPVVLPIRFLVDAAIFLAFAIVSTVACWRLFASKGACAKRLKHASYYAIVMKVLAIISMVGVGTYGTFLLLGSFLVGELDWIFLLLFAVYYTSNLVKLWGKIATYYKNISYLASAASSDSPLKYQKTGFLSPPIKRLRIFAVIYGIFALGSFICSLLIFYIPTGIGPQYNSLLQMFFVLTGLNALPIAVYLIFNTLVFRAFQAKLAPACGL